VSVGLVRLQFSIYAVILEVIFDRDMDIV